MLFNNKGEISSDLLQAMVKQCQKQEVSFISKPNYIKETKRESELDCSCGGKLTEVSSIIDPVKYALCQCGPKPKVKTRRKRKIALAKYRRRFKQTVLCFYMAAPISRRKHYICETCGKIMGMYEAIGRNIIKVELLPMGE